MFKIVSTAAIAALFATSAMAVTKIPAFKFTGGQFVGSTQYTNLVDPNNFCAGVAGLAVGQVTSSVATIAALGDAWTETIANSNPSPTSTYGVTWINCSFAALPAATTFVGTNIGTTAAPVYLYTSTPTASQTTSCLASNGDAYTLTSGNGSITTTLFNGGAGTTETETQSLTITGLPVNGTGKDYGFRLTSNNSVLAVAPYGPICFLSTDAVYLNSSK